jgi:hypothetical protein
MNKLYGYRIQFVQPLSDVPTRELYQAYRRLWRITEQVRFEASGMCRDGRRIASILRQPIEEMMNPLRVELMRRYGVEKIMRQDDLFQERLECTAPTYRIGVGLWKNSVSSDAVNEKRKEIARRKSVDFFLPVLGIGVLENYMRPEDDIPF